MKVYSSYDEEPEIEFLPLPESMYTALYAQEMSEFTQDIPFYTAALQRESTVLELGCGTGRLTRGIASAGHEVVGVDLSLPMLQTANTTVTPNVHYLCMDMRRLAFSQKAGAVIIPYNTLNLLVDNDDVRMCLRGCWEHLEKDGKLLIQLYILPDDFRSQPGKTTFQFQLFDTPQGGKIIKEILRRYNKSNNQLEMIERYKIRPMTSHQQNSNYEHTLYLNANTQDEWLNLIDSAGFAVTSLATQYDYRTEHHPSLLLIEAEKRE